jgi:hypothetical protein
MRAHEEAATMVDYSSWANRRVAEYSESQARRAAKRVGLQARKSRWRCDNPLYNRGGFQIIDPMRNWIVAAEKYNFTADDVVEFCAEYGKRQEKLYG